MPSSPPKHCRLRMRSCCSEAATIRTRARRPTPTWTQPWIGSGTRPGSIKPARLRSSSSRLATDGAVGARTARNRRTAARALLLSLGVPDSANRHRGPQPHHPPERPLYRGNRGRTGGSGEVLLTTSAWHMPRAEATFRRVELTVIPAATDYLPRSLRLSRASGCYGSSRPSGGFPSAPDRSGNISACWSTARAAGPERPPPARSADAAASSFPPSGSARAASRKVRRLAAGSAEDAQASRQAIVRSKFRTPRSWVSP